MLTLVAKERLEGKLWVVDEQTARVREGPQDGLHKITRKPGRHTRLSATRCFGRPLERERQLLWSETTREIRSGSATKVRASRCCSSLRNPEHYWKPMFPKCVSNLPMTTTKNKERAGGAYIALFAMCARGIASA